MTAASPIVYVSTLCIRQLRARYYYGRSPEYLLRTEREQLIRSAGPQLAAVTPPLPAPRRRAVGMLTCLLARSAPGGFAGPRTWGCPTEWVGCFALLGSVEPGRLNGPVLDLQGERVVLLVEGAARLGGGLAPYRPNADAKLAAKSDELNAYGRTTTFVPTRTRS